MRCNEISPKKERTIERAFYYWKSVLTINKFEKNTLTDLGAETLYLKFFDVDWNNTSGKPVPVAQVRINERSVADIGNLKIIPVIFITNACMLHLDSLSATELAIKIPTLVNEICSSNGLSFSEVQVDCDWTARSRVNYFILLKGIRKYLHDKKISATIRLYQVKYLHKTGVPPVDRGLLMAYNMGNLKDPATNNSILETTELKKYVGALSSYPLPLDIALPLFEWKVLFRNNSFTGLIQDLDDALLVNPLIKEIEGNRFLFLKDTLLNGYSFFKGDVLRKEESSFNEILSAGKILSNNLRDTSIRVSLFHLDSLILNKYSKHEMEEIFNSLH